MKRKRAPKPRRPKVEYRVDLAELLEERDAWARAFDRERAAFEAYRERLVNLLDADQIEATKITGCPPDEYAIQLIRLCKQKIDEMKAWRP